jgi:hypothetical protein
MEGTSCMWFVNVALVQASSPSPADRQALILVRLVRDHGGGQGPPMISSASLFAGHQASGIRRLQCEA